MDFQHMKRRQLQSLCKLNNIPANLTNAAMATALSNLPTVEGLEEFLRDPTAGDFGSPDVPRTTTRQKVTIGEPEGSTLTTRTHGTRRQAVEGTGTRKTPATRTNRKKASEEATVQKQAKKDLQADFEADLEQSEVSDNSGLLGDSMETSGDVSAVSVDNDAELSLESQSETEKVVQEVVNDVPEVFDDVSKDEEEPTEMYNSNRKVDFHSLGRRDLQGLCKKNKIPANTSNATMADALESLEIVEGLEEFLEECNSQAPRSPTMSEMTSSCARRTWTSRRVSKEPASSKLITKSCRGSRKKVIEEIDQDNTSAVSQTSEAGTAVCSVESVQKRELQTYSRRVTVASAAKPSENIECPGDVVSKEGSLSVVDAAEIGNSEALDFLDTSNGYTQEAVAMSKFDESLEDVNASEKDAEKGDYDILATENVKLLEDSENKKDSDVDQISIGVSVIPEQLQNTVNEIALSESKDSQLENGTNASDAGFENKSENSELQNPNEGTSAKSSEDSEVSSDAESENGSENSELQNVNEGAGTKSSEDSEVSTDAGSEDRSDNSELQYVNEGTCTKTSDDSEVSSDAGSENGSENSDFENVDEGVSAESSEDSEVSSDAGSENESENREFENIDEGTNTGGLDKLEPELPTVADEVNNTETENQLVDSDVFSSDTAGQLCPVVEQTENNHAEEENTSRNDALITHPNEKVEASYAERDMSKEVYSESTIQTKGKKTPLEKKSMRQLKKILKEKLQEPNALSKKLENLTLEGIDDSLAKVEEDRDDESEDLEGGRADDLEDLIESIDVTSAENFDGEDLQATFDANAVSLYPVDTILDNLISEDAVTGDINVEFDQELTSEKHSSNTPSKTMMPLVSSLSKTPVSVAKMNHASDVNKENIDHSASKTKSTKNSAARTENILSPMSIRMLKKAIVGVQQQHSEKKRPPLLARSENCHPLASP